MPVLEMIGWNVIKESFISMYIKVKMKVSKKITVNFEKPNNLINNEFFSCYMLMIPSMYYLSYRFRMLILCN